MRVKPYIVRARKALLTVTKPTPIVYFAGSVCGVRFLDEKDVERHDTGPRFKGRDAEGMAKRGAHFILTGERLEGGRTGL